ncbi:MAG: AAA family ATPase [Magnetococcales bacterium]|nr:AAA family ATPase [Magnetococcales bacterium]
MSDEIIVHEFRPLFLTVENIGPFQGKPYTVDFTTSDNEPCNFFLLISENGRGKTTLLETMVDLVSLLSTSNGLPLKMLREELKKDTGRAQIDFFFKYNFSGSSTKAMIFSIEAGKRKHNPLKDWAEDEVQIFSARNQETHIWLNRSTKQEKWHRRNKVNIGPQSGRLEMFADFAQKARGQSPGQTENNPPTILFFPDNRGIPPADSFGNRSISQPSNWRYQLVHQFGLERGWNRSLDNMLVWLSWLDDGRLEKAKQMVNDWAFKDTNKVLEGIRKEPPEAVVNNNGVKHRLDLLSGGERNLVQLCLRLGAHMTQNTIVLIDELDLHLHIKWQHRLLNRLKGMVKENPGLTVIATTHSKEIIEAFASDLKEEGLRKGGQIIDLDTDR